MNDKQQLAAMGEHLAEQPQPLCMAKRIEELEAQVRELTTPEGWQMVPVEPTQKMVAVGCENEGSRITDGAEFARALYADMLAAAPKPDSTK